MEIFGKNFDKCQFCGEFLEPGDNVIDLGAGELSHEECFRNAVKADNDLLDEVIDEFEAGRNVEYQRND